MASWRENCPVCGLILTPQPFDFEKQSYASFEDETHNYSENLREKGAGSLGRLLTKEQVSKEYFNGLLEIFAYEFSKHHGFTTRLSRSWISHLEFLFGIAPYEAELLVTEMLELRERVLTEQLIWERILRFEIAKLQKRVTIKDFFKYLQICQVVKAQQLASEPSRRDLALRLLWSRDLRQFRNTVKTICNGILNDKSAIAEWHTERGTVGAWSNYNKFG